MIIKKKKNNGSSSLYANQLHFGETITQTDFLSKQLLQKNYLLPLFRPTSQKTGWVIAFFRILYLVVNLTFTVLMQS